MPDPVPQSVPFRAVVVTDAPSLDAELHAALRGGTQGDLAKVELIPWGRALDDAATLRGTTCAVLDLRQQVAGRHLEELTARARRLGLTLTLVHARSARSSPCDGPDATDAPSAPPPVAGPAVAPVRAVAAALRKELNAPAMNAAVNITYAADGLAAAIESLRSLQKLVGVGDAVNEIIVTLREAHDALTDARAATARLEKIADDLGRMATTPSDAHVLAEVLERALLRASVELAGVRIERDYSVTPLVDAAAEELEEHFVTVVTALGRLARLTRSALRVRSFAERRNALSVRFQLSGGAPDAFEANQEASTASGATEREREFEIEIESLEVLARDSRFSTTVERSDDGRRVTLDVRFATDGRRLRSEVRRGRILVVDDDEGSVTALREVLAPEHEVVVETVAGRVLARVAGAAGFDVVFASLAGADPMGIDVYFTLVAHDPSIARRVVFLVDESPSLRAEAFAERVKHPTVAKPIVPGLVRAIVSDYVGA